MPPRRVVTGRSQEPSLRFAQEVRRLRLKKGVTFRELGDALGWDASLFGKIESGATLGSPEVAQGLDTYYGTDDLLLSHWELAVRDPKQFREGYRRYMNLEAEALSLWHHAVSALPGLLQTEAYARALLAAGGLEGEELELQVQARIGRRELLERADAPRFRTVLSESVLRTSLRNPGEWREQLDYLLKIGERPNVFIQAMPHRGGFHALTNTDVMFLRGHDGRTAAWVESGYSGELIEDTEASERLQLRYDLIRDLALSPGETREFIKQILEEFSCESSI
ncbi:helix-turn-helix domain-containing protein [Streptomyces sp. NPDC059080]|uniref:helix-turn-helix domain-containing protein n=1 Tax=Streptomyces sp. NPDC059080 TaxID=3346718 RepID=UPI0036AC5534